MVKNVLLTISVFFVIASFLEDSFFFILILGFILTVSACFKFFSHLSMASKHVCNQERCSEENHLTWKILSSVGILNPEINPVKSLNFLIDFVPTNHENICTLQYSNDYMNLSVGVWQVCVADISIIYNSANLPEVCQGGILAIKSNVVLGLNESNFSTEVILDKFYFQRLRVDHNSDIEYIKNDNKTWYTVNCTQRLIKVSVESFIGSPSTFCTGQIVVHLLFRKLK